MGPIGEPVGQGLEWHKAGGQQSPHSVRVEGRIVRNTLISLSDGTSAAVVSDVEIAFEGCAPKPKLYASLFFEQAYDPTPIVEKPYPVKISISGRAEPIPAIIGSCSSMSL